MKRLKAKGIEIVIHGPTHFEGTFFNSKIPSSFSEPKELTGFIISSRILEDLSAWRKSIYTGLVWVRLSYRGSK